MLKRNKFKLIFTLSGLSIPTLSFANDLKVNDPVGISFWLISIIMVAATVFFLMSVNSVNGKWRTSMIIAALVTLVAGIHYFYMREIWVTTGQSPTVYRYIDWLITVPLQLIEFYLILAASATIALPVFWRLFVFSIVMLLSGYLGETDFINPYLGLVVGILAWIAILYELFLGEAAKVCAEKAPASVQQSFSVMKWIVTLGWAIYPLGYIFGYLVDGIDAATLNFIYNIADLVNKIIFCLAIWACAVKVSETDYKSK